MDDPFLTGCFIFIGACLVILLVGGCLSLRTNKKIEDGIKKNKEKLEKLKKEFEKENAEFVEEHASLLKKKIYRTDKDDEHEEYMALENNEDGEKVLRYYFVSLPKEPDIFTVNAPTPYEKGRILHSGEADMQEAGCYDMKVDDILFFKEVGDISYTTELTKGYYDKASVIGGAIMYGAVGAASRAAKSAVDSIETKTVKHDSREIIMKFKDAKEETFPISYKDAFMKLIPEKEYDFVMMNQKQA